MTEQMHHRIQSHITRTKFLHVEDALHYLNERDEPIPKLRIYAGQYQRGQGTQTWLVHYIDLASARPLLHDLSWAKPVDFADFKGGRKNGGWESRVLTINRNKDRYYIELERGPGKPLKTGAVKPAGRPTDSVNVPFTVDQIRELAYSILGYIQAWEVKRQLEREEEPVFESRDERADEKPDLDELNDQLFGPEYDPDDEEEMTYANGDSIPENRKVRTICRVYLREHPDVIKPSKHVVRAWYDDLSVRQRQELGINYTRPAPAA